MPSSLLTDARKSPTTPRRRSAVRRAAAAGLFKLVRQSGRKLAQRCQTIALLLGPRDFASAIDHGGHQAPAQFRHVAQQIVEQ